MPATKNSGFVKIAIEKEGQLPLLTTFDQSRPLDEIIKEVAVNWNLPIPEQYAFQYSDFNCYITEENRTAIKNGAVLKLSLSPAKLANEIYEKLYSGNPEENKNALAQLATISEDATFAGEFIQRKGLGILIGMVEGKQVSSEILANALSSFEELMEHGEVAWDILTQGSIKNLTVLVNKTSPVDPTVLKRCLSVLESVVSNSSALYPMVEKEVVLENVAQHLQSPKQDIQLNAIGLINSLFMKTSNRRLFVDRVKKIGIRNFLLNNIIRSSKPIKEDMAHQLYVYQALMFSLLEDRLLARGNPQSQNLVESLDTLRKVAFESDLVTSGAGRPLSRIGDTPKDFKRLGFTNTDNPANDFSEAPPGLLPLHCMVFFAKKHQEEYIKVVLENLSRGDDYECPFARSSIALTKMLCEILKISGEQPSEASKEYYPIFFTTDYAFEEFYCICIQLVNKTWKEMRATSGDFGRVMQVVNKQIVRALSEKQPTLEMFKTNVFNLGFAQTLKLIQQETHERNIMELKAKPVVELRKQILPELREVVKQQRLDQLVQGALFDRTPGKTRVRDKFWYCRLSPNLKFLHYGDCEDGQSPQLEALPNKLSIAKLKSLVVGKDCPHAKEKKTGKTLVPLFFSLFFESDTSEDDHLDFIAPNPNSFAIWTDALLTLIGKGMASKEAQEDLETLLNMEMKLRLLDLEGISIPDQSPSIPPEPPNYHFVYNFN